MDTSSDEIVDSGSTDHLDTSESEELPIEECTLQVTIQSIQTASGTTFLSIHAGTNRFHHNGVASYNPCEHSEIRFLEFQQNGLKEQDLMDTLPPISSHPQESSQLSFYSRP